MDLFISVQIGIFVLIAAGFIYHKSKYKRQYPLTLEMYLAENPDCKTDSGMKCNACGSKSLKNMGFDSATSSKRMISCNHCGKRLYRVKN